MVTTPTYYSSLAPKTARTTADIIDNHLVDDDDRFQPNIIVITSGKPVITDDSGRAFPAHTLRCRYPLTDLIEQRRRQTGVTFIPAELPTAHKRCRHKPRRRHLPQLETLRLPLGACGRFDDFLKAILRQVSALPEGIPANLFWLKVYGADLLDAYDYVVWWLQALHQAGWVSFCDDGWMMYAHPAPDNLDAVLYGTSRPFPTTFLPHLQPVPLRRPGANVPPDQPTAPQTLRRAS